MKRMSVLLGQLDLQSFSRAVRQRLDIDSISVLGSILAPAGHGCNFEEPAATSLHIGRMKGDGIDSLRQYFFKQ
jgi:hypothetical protein